MTSRPEFPGIGRRPMGESWHYVAGHESPAMREAQLQAQIEDLTDEILRLETRVTELEFDLKDVREEAAHARVA
jgi:TolA-binding protein